METRKLDGTSFDIVADNIQKLKELFPEAVSGDNEVNIDVLRDIFEKYDENVVTDNEEFYKFTWWGKKEAKNIAKASTTKTLRPVKKDSKNWDSTNNIYIEGDNLDALKILSGYYRNRIKMIYIDPPYNTGKDFVYVDKYGETNKELLERTGQLNEDGFLDENPKTDGKYHSKWLNMIYSRLILARKLLTDDGIIFISIDDNEVDNLRKISNEIFGENNFMAQIVVEGTPKNDPYIVSTAHEYCLVYVKNLDVAKTANYGLKNPLYAKINNIFKECADDFDLVEMKLKEFYKSNSLTKNNISNYKFADSQGIFRTGPIDDPQNSGPKDDRINPFTNTPCIIPNGGWRCNIETWNNWVEKDLILFPKNNDKIPAKKTYITDDRLDVMKAYVKMQTRKDTDALKKLFGMNITPFSNPKPKQLIKTFIENCNDSDITVLDFFSGSATTAEAVIDLNSEDNGDRKFILVQLPQEISVEGSQSGKEKKISKAVIEFLDKQNKKHNICEIGKERIRRAGDKIVEESGNEDLDIGFKVFKVDESNFIPWNPKITSENVEQAILSANNNLVSGRSEIDLVYELLLKELNLDLNSSIDEVVLDNEFKNKIYVIRNGFALICLDEKLSESLAEDLLKLKNELKSSYCKVILKDSALDDNHSINNYELLSSENVKFYTI